jgi:hypothetical protein
MNLRRALTTLLTCLAVPLTVGVPPAHANDSATMAATVAPATAWPKARPCTTGTGVHDFTVSGTGFQPEERLDVAVGGVAYPAAVADAAGAYSVTYEVQALPAGRYPVAVRGDRGGKAVGRIDVGFSGCRSTEDGVLRVTGAGFTAADTIRVRLDGEPAAVATGRSSETGEFDIRTECAPGKHTIEVADTHDRMLNFAEFSC